MTHPIAESSPRTYARVAGAGYLVIIVAGIFAEFVVRSRLVVRGDAAATAANIVASEGLFRIGLAADVVMLIADVVVAVALYVVFRDVSWSLALLAALFRVTHAGAYAATLLSLYVPLVLLGSAEYLTAFDTEQRQAMALLLLGAHGFGYVIALVFFGVHCLVLGHLVRRSGLVPKALGALLMVAGAGYLIDSFGRALLIDYAGVESVFAVVVFVPAFVAELSFCLWLLLKGIR